MNDKFSCLNHFFFHRADRGTLPGSLCVSKRAETNKQTKVLFFKKVNLSKLMSLKTFFKKGPEVIKEAKSLIFYV